MRAQRQQVSEAFWQKRIVSCEAKKRYDPYWVWDGTYRWFASLNIIKLEDYRDTTEMDRIRMSILKPAKERAKYCAA